MEYEVDEDPFAEAFEGIFQKLLCCKVSVGFPYSFSTGNLPQLLAANR